MSLLPGGRGELMATSEANVPREVWTASGRGPSRGSRAGPDATGQCELPGPNPLPTLAFLEASDPAPFGGTSAAAPVVARFLAAHIVSQATPPDGAAVLAWIRQPTKHKAVGAVGEAGYVAVP